MMWRVHKGLINLALILYAKFCTVVFYIKYAPYLKLKNKCTVTKGVRVNPFSSSLMINLGGRTRIGRYTVFQGGGKFSIGDNSWCGDFCVFGTNESIYIGANVMIADAVTIRDTDHNHSNSSVPMVEQGITTSPVIIEDDVWVGHGATILKGVVIGRGSIIAAGAVVNRCFPEGSIVAGVPAKLIKQREVR